MTIPNASPLNGGLMPARLAELAQTTFIWSGTSTGSANAQTITPEFAPLALTGHPSYVFVAGYTNTGALTLAFSNAPAGMGTVSVRRPDGSACAGGEVQANQLYSVMLDSSGFFRLTGFLNPMTTAGDLIIGGTAGAPTRLAPGASDGAVLTMVSGLPAWFYPIGWNPADKGSGVTLSNNNTSAAISSVANYTARGITGLSSGKWYWEILCVSGSNFHIGAAQSTASLSTFVGATSDGWSYRDNGNKRGGSTFSGDVAYGSTYTAGDVVGVALDMTNGRIYFSKNGVWQASGDPVAGTNYAFNGLTGTVYPAASNNSSTALSVTMRAASNSWSYSAPSGYGALHL